MDIDWRLRVALDETNNKLDSIKEMIYSEYSTRELERNIKFLIFCYRKSYSKELLPVFDSLIYFIKSSISSDYYHDKKVLLDAIDAFDEAYNDKKISVECLLKIVPYMDQYGKYPELLEILFKKYCISVINMKHFYQRYKRFFNVKEDTLIPLEGISLHDEIVSDWELHGDDIYTNIIKIFCYNVNYDFKLFCNNVVLIENAAKNDNRIASLVSDAKDRFYVKKENFDFSKPEYNTYFTRVLSLPKDND